MSHQVLLGLIGYPLGHSLSPKLHQASLEAAGLEGEYSLFPVAPGNEDELKEILGKVRRREVHGLNVTIPHKQTIIPYLDELKPSAQAIGAVNTIYLRNNKLIGDNTDAPGFLADLKDFFFSVKFSLSHKNALVFGAGGSARAVVHSLLQDGWQITLAARRIEQAQDLRSKIGDRKAKIDLCPMPLEENDLRSLIFDLIINTTPLGMTPNLDTSPWPADLPFPENAAVYDLVYNPRETKLIRDARTAGLHATTGLGMLVEQAALAFEIWTELRADRDAMRNAVK